MAGPGAVATRGAGWWMAAAATVHKLPSLHLGEWRGKLRKCQIFDTWIYEVNTVLGIYLLVEIPSW